MARSLVRDSLKRRRWRPSFALRSNWTALLSLMLLALFLMVAFGDNSPLASRARSLMADITKDVMSGASAITGAADNVGEALGEIADIQAENARLRAEVNELLDWRSKALALERELRSYESVLKIAYTPIEGVVAASVIADASGPFTKALLINAGANAGVQAGDVALDRYGLVGRVIEAGRRTARILLLTDPSSRVPVLAGANGPRAILTGDTGGDPRLEFLPSDAALVDGAMVLTSGDGGVLPPGLPVGTLMRDPEGGTVWRVRLFADIARVEAVAIKRYAAPTDPRSEPVENVVSAAGSPAPPEAAPAALVPAPPAQAPQQAPPAIAEPAPAAPADDPDAGD